MRAARRADIQSVAPPTSLNVRFADADSLSSYDEEGLKSGTPNMGARWVEVVGLCLPRLMGGPICPIS